MFNHTRQKKKSNSGTTLEIRKTNSKSKNQKENFKLKSKQILIKNCKAKKKKIKLGSYQKKIEAVHLMGSQPSVLLLYQNTGIKCFVVGIGYYS